jgi:hypothetical protein
MDAAAPQIVSIANLWSLVEYPSVAAEWTLERKLQAVKEAGFDGINWKADKRLAKLLQKFELRLSGLIEFPREDQFKQLIAQQMDAGAETINVQLAAHDTPIEEAIRLTLLLMEESDRQNANVHLETHRNTCTETPEKAYAIADGYQKATGKLLRMNFDFSHLAVVKHLAPQDFARRLLDRPELLQHGNLSHCRPFNGHHCQVPVTDGRGNLTREFRDYLPFVEKVFRCWLAGPRPYNQFWVEPEMGPAASGYGITTWPPPWEDTMVARKQFETIWNKVIRET